jgi:hypothetical protein
MLQLLFTLMLELGLLGGSAQPQKDPNATQISTQTTTEAGSSVKKEADDPDVTVGTDVSIGGSGWDDKN